MTREIRIGNARDALSAIDILVPFPYFLSLIPFPCHRRTVGLAMKIDE